MPQGDDLDLRLNRLREEVRVDIGSSAARLREEIQATETRLTQEIRDSAAETRRHFDVVVESMHSADRLLAEGFTLLDEKVERLRAEMREAQQATDRRLLRVEARVVPQREG